MQYALLSILLHNHFMQAELVYETVWLHCRPVCCCCCCCWSVTSHLFCDAFRLRDLPLGHTCISSAQLYIPLILSIVSQAPIHIFLSG